MTKVKYGLIEAMQLLATDRGVKKITEVDSGEELYVENGSIYVGGGVRASAPLRYITESLRASLWYVEWSYDTREGACTFERAYNLVDAGLAEYAERIVYNEQRALVKNGDGMTIRTQRVKPDMPDIGILVHDFEPSDLTSKWRVYYAIEHKMYDVVVIHARSPLSEKEVVTKTDTTYAEALLSLSDGFEPFTAVGFANGRPETIIEVTELGDVY